MQSDNIQTSRIKEEQKDSGIKHFLPEGSDFGRYRNLNLIGYGGSSSVYKAYDPEMDRYIAIKILHDKGLCIAEARERFKREIKEQGRLSISGIARIYDCGEEMGRFYYTMELIDGDNIIEYAEKKSLDTLERIALLAHLARIIAKLHTLNLVHRDIKPSNVMVDAHGDIRLLDFGLAKPINTSFNELNKLTQEGDILGTPLYMPPELLDAFKTKTANPKSADVYALGILAYELLTGRIPFEIEHLPIEELACVIGTEAPADMKKFNSSIPERAEKIILRALSKNPADRPSAEQFAEELENSIQKSSNNRLSLNSKTLFTLLATFGIMSVFSIIVLQYFPGLSENAKSKIIQSKDQHKNKIIEQQNRKVFEFPISIHPQMQTKDSDIQQKGTERGISQSSLVSKESIPSENLSSKDIVKLPQNIILQDNNRIQEDAKSISVKEKPYVDVVENITETKLQENTSTTREKIELAKVTNMVNEPLEPMIQKVKDSEPLKTALSVADKIAKNFKIDIKPKLVEKPGLLYLRSGENKKVFSDDENAEAKFFEGDKVEFEIYSEKDCYIAVFIHQSDGTTFLLYPNKWSQNPRLSANTKILFPILVVSQKLLKFKGDGFLFPV